MSKQETGILFICFKDSINQNKIRDFIENLYLENTNLISGMEWNEFDSKQTYKEVKQLIHKQLKQDEGEEC